MSKRSIAFLILYVLLAGTAYYFAWSSHMDVFPCERTNARGMKDERSCAPMWTKRAGDVRFELTGAGRAMVWGFIFVAPLPIAALGALPFPGRKKAPLPDAQASAAK